MDERVLAEKYEVTSLNIASCTQISKAAAIIISKITSPRSGDKQVIVVLKAKARVANKLISIVEIAKRELASSDTKCFQYNSLSSEMIEIPRKSSKAVHGVESEMNEGEESDEAFETMGTLRLTGPKKRRVPIMTTYLSGVPVRELNGVCGEQR